LVYLESDQSHATVYSLKTVHSCMLRADQVDSKHSYTNSIGEQIMEFRIPKRMGAHIEFHTVCYAISR